MPVVQCKGSGNAAGVGLNIKRAQCRYCGQQVEVAKSTGRLRKHMRRMTKAQMRRRA